MFKVLDCITTYHDHRLVILAVLLCLFASVTAMTMLSRARATTGRAARYWGISVGLVAGCGIWATHFVAMQAFEPGFPAGYDIPQTALSIVIAAVLAAAGFTTSLSLRSRAVAGPVAGGLIAGAAIIAMHYTGMAALRVPATEQWDAGGVAASVLAGLSLTVVAFYLAFRANSWRRYALSAVVFTLAVCTMHFTAMSAVSFRYDPTVSISDFAVSRLVVAALVSMSALFILALGCGGAMIDYQLAERNRGEAARLRDYVAKLELARQQQDDSTQKMRVALATAAQASQAKSEFLASLSHELRTPLNAVIGFSELMSTEACGPLGMSRYREYARDIHNSGKHLLAMINDMLDLARLDAGTMTLQEDICNPQEIVRQAIRMVTSQARKKNLSLLNDVPTGLPLVSADERRLRQVLINILANAIKFTPDGGTITARAEIGTDDLTIAVTDTGIGIAPDMLDKALEPFGQIDASLAREHGGAGLGLPLSKQLMEMHGGSLSLESELNTGTTVKITIPASRFRDRAHLTAA